MTDRFSLEKQKTIDDNKRRALESEADQTQYKPQIEERFIIDEKYDFDQSKPMSSPTESLVKKLGGRKKRTRKTKKSKSRRSKKKITNKRRR